GDTAGAIAELQKSKAPDPGAWYQGFLGYAYAISGERAKAEQACANSNNWRNGNTSVQRRSRRSILDLVKKKNVWIGWRNLTSSRTALVGILRLTRSTTAFGTSRASRRW